MWIWLGCKNKSTIEYEIFGVATLIGVGGNAMQLTSLTIICNFIGSNIGMIGVIFSYKLFSNPLHIGERNNFSKTGHWN